MSEEKPFFKTLLIDISMFIVLILINLLPVALFMQNGMKAAMKLDFKGIMDAGNGMLITLIILNICYILAVYMVPLLKTNMTKYWAYLAVFDILWWGYCLVS